MKRGTQTIVEFGMLKETLISLAYLSGGGYGGCCINREKCRLAVIRSGERGSPMSELVSVET